MKLADLAAYDRTLGARDGRDAMTSRGADYARESFAELSADHHGSAYVIGYLEGMTAAAPRACLQCGRDLTDAMGCYLFVALPDANPARLPGIVATRGPLLCIDHGAGIGGNVARLETVREWFTGGRTR